MASLSDSWVSSTRLWTWRWLPESLIQIHYNHYLYFISATLRIIDRRFESQELLILHRTQTLIAEVMMLTSHTDWRFNPERKAADLESAADKQPLNDENKTWELQPLSVWAAASCWAAEMSATWSSGLQLLENTKLQVTHLQQLHSHTSFTDAFIRAISRKTKKTKTVFIWILSPLGLFTD